MSLTLYNTLTRQKQPFQPIDPSNVRMYVCGPTVYDLAHIGNARPIIVFDVLFRLLRHIYGPDHVTYARNITDVDDKINARAVERYPDMPPTEAIGKLTAETIEQFHKDIAALGVLEPTIEPRATDHISEMRELCEALVAKGHAYVADGHVLFDVASMPDYGRLANRSLEEMEAGARVEVATYKKGAMDFVLWKPSKPDEPSWPAPCGIETPGRPGWHLECSAMSDRWLWQEAELSDAGKAQPHVFDIHGGGIDLMFPHHENEIAQSRCGHGTHAMANVWMHNGFLQVEGEKMSKSLGNFITINELLEGQGSQGRLPVRGDVFRLNMLKTHYRQPINWTERGTLVSHGELAKWKEILQGPPMAFIEQNRSMYESEQPSADVLFALCDDLNTPKAISSMHTLSKSSDPDSHWTLYASGKLLGLWSFDSLASEFEEQERLSTIDPPVVRRLIAARIAARKAKDFAESDRIRDELTAMGIQLKDGKDPETGEPITTWEVKR